MNLAKYVQMVGLRETRAHFFLKYVHMMVKFVRKLYGNHFSFLEVDPKSVPSKISSFYTCSSQVDFSEICYKLIYEEASLAFLRLRNNERISQLKADELGCRKRSM